MRRKKIVLAGGGGHCKSVLDSLLSGGEYDEIVITDPVIRTESRIMGCRVVGGDEKLPYLREVGFDYAFVSLGSIHDSSVRNRIATIIEDLSFTIPIIKDPTAAVSSMCMIGKGTFIGKNAVINAEARIGEHCIINSGAIVEHECIVGNFCHVAVGAVLCGQVSVGADSFIGAGAIITQGMKLEKGTFVKANRILF